MRDKLTVFAFVLLLFSPADGSSQTDCVILDNFDGGFNEAWLVSDATKVQAVDDVLRVQFTGAAPTEVHWATSQDCLYQDFMLEAKVRDRDGAGSVVISIRNHGPDHLGYSINLRSSRQDIVLAKGPWGLRYEVVASAPIQHSTDQWRTVKVFASGPRIQVYVDGDPYIDVVDPEPYLEGWIDLGINAGGNLMAFAEFDDVHVEATLAVAVEEQNWGVLKARY